MSNEQEAPKKRWWLSWQGPKISFKYNGPWWLSGYSLFRRADGESFAKPTFVAAILAETDEAARIIVEKSYDKPVKLEWRFTLERAEDWEPFSERFPRGDWMQWPARTQEASC